MVDVRGDVLRPPHGTIPAAVKFRLINKTVHRGLNYVFDLLNRSLYVTLFTEQQIELIDFEIIIKSP